RGRVCAGIQTLYAWPGARKIYWMDFFHRHRGPLMNVEKTGAARLRAVLARPGMRVAPGAYDCITARMVEQAGFELAYMSGAGTAASLGYPDYGLLSLNEMADNA